MRPTPSFKAKCTDKEAAISAMFIDQHGSEYHETLGEKAYYNHQTTWFEPTESEDTTPSDDLRTALEEYNETTQEKYRLNISYYNLSDVLLEIAEAEGKYNQKGKGVVHAPRHIGRSAGDYAYAISPWLDLIPSDHELNFLTAGLKATLNIVKKNADNRQKILQALQEIPDVMLLTQKQQNIFSSVPKLRDEAIALCKVLARCLARLIATLNPSRSKGKVSHHTKRLGKRFIPYHTATGIDHILGEMKTGVGKFSNSLELIRDECAMGAYNNIGKVLTHTTHIQDTFYLMQQDISTLARGFREIRKEQQAMHKEQVDSKNYLHLFIRSNFPSTPFFLTLHIVQPSQP
ncbi:hypothetical protein RU639_009431 [Aspergillus parasiticus]